MILLRKEVGTPQVGTDSYISNRKIKEVKVWHLPRKVLNGFFG
jgi:hypothetical protein